MSISLRKLLLLTLVIAALTGAGCVPSAVWLPDSSGFIFIDKFESKKGTRLVRYDIKSKKRTVLVENTNTGTTVPGVSRDGKKIAVAMSKVSCTKGSANITKTFQVLIYDLEGKLLSKCKRFEATEQAPKEAEATGDTLEQVLLNWSGPTDKLLVTCGRTPFNKADEKKTLIYDLKTDKVIAVDGVAWYPNNRQVRPDGKGFLLTPEGERGLAFSDWQGQTKEIKGPKEILYPPEDPCHADWSKNVFRVRMLTRAFDLDTETGKAVLTKDKLALLEAPGKVLQAWPFAGTKSWLCVYQYKEDAAEKDSQNVERLELQIPGEKKRKIILEGKKGAVRYGVNLYFAPSPDGKLLAVNYSEEVKGKSMNFILVIDAKGDIVAKVPWEE